MIRVLLVDDSAFMRKILKEMIEGDSFHVIGECSSGLDAIEKYRSMAPELVLMDYNMPGMDGLETARSIVDYDPSANIIMISSVDTTENVAEAIESGVKDYLTKPFTKEEVLAKLSEAMAK